MHDRNIPIAHAIIQPALQLRNILKANFFEDMKTIFVLTVDNGIHLMKMDHLMRIPDEMKQSRFGKSPVTIPLLYHDANFRTAVLWNKIGKIDDTYRLALCILNDEPELLVGVDISGDTGKVFMQGKPGIWHIGNTNIPQFLIVLNLIEDL